MFRMRSTLLRFRDQHESEKLELQQQIGRRKERKQIGTGWTSITLISNGIDVITDFLRQSISGSYHGVEDNLGILWRIGSTWKPSSHMLLVRNIT